MGIPEFTTPSECSNANNYGVFLFSTALLDSLGEVSEQGLSMVTVHATFDDVGNTKDGISAVVGYVAYSDEWKKFNWRWTMSLEQLKLPYLHTSKYLNQFWLSDHEITDEDICLILAPFIEAVKGTLLAGGAIPVCVITDHAAYNQLTDQEKKVIRPPEDNSFETALALASRALRSPMAMTNAIAVQMDESRNAPQLYAAYEAMKRDYPEFKAHLGALCFCDDEKHPPIQAADMFANIVLKSFRRFEEGKEQPRAIRELSSLDGQPTKLIYRRYHSDNLRRLAKIRIERGSRMEVPDSEDAL